MEENFFKNLPPEIVINILSRLPLRPIAISKCVCKSWLDLLKTDYFVNSHLAKSVSSSLAVSMPNEKSNSSMCKVFEYEDELDSRYNLLTEFVFPHPVKIEGSANGLLLLNDLRPSPDTLYICNPITREYVQICCSEEEIGSCYKLGVSKISGQCKVVAMNKKSECHVYTLGTDSWRLVEARAPIKYHDFYFALSVNGSLHCTGSDSNSALLILCFDLETESFSSFCGPAPCGVLSALEDCLCFSKWEEDKFVIWLMLDDGDEKCWRKEYVISEGPFVGGFSYDYVYPIKIFRNGDILMAWEEVSLFCYSNETKTVEEIVGLFDSRRVFLNKMLLTPSFLSLKDLFKPYTSQVGVYVNTLQETPYIYTNMKQDFLNSHHLSKSAALVVSIPQRERGSPLATAMFTPLAQDGVKVVIGAVYDGAFVNGDLFWRVSDSKDNKWICCFDLKTECFSTFSSPPVRGGIFYYEFNTLRDCLCSGDDSKFSEMVTS